jgi:phosphoribosyl-AMP cyclohydrolase / phosphoribosyl-ATP pyrophosphohydrolase
MLVTKGDLDIIKYNAQGLVPAVAQDASTGAVLMLAWMNTDALAKTIETGYAHYYSRSRQTLWFKGETSGHTQKVMDILLDCDGDTILLKVEQKGAACHTNNFTCFNESLAADSDGPAPGFEALRSEFEVIKDRQVNRKDGSYTNYLFDKGIEKICKKIGEESSEVIIAAMKGNNDEMRYEAADLIYHLMVAMANQGLGWEDILVEVEKRKHG